ncbi:MAG: phosphoribosylamine--glycine ligase, partial [Dehalococcoidia bacterium]
MNVLVIGAGAREHAIAWKLRQSAKVSDLFVAPGNAGIAQVAETLPLAIPKPHAPDAEVAAFCSAVVAMARERRADLVAVASDDPLGLGLVDALKAAGITAFGPTKAAARIEASKAFAKEIMERNAIPMSVAARFDDFEQARRYVESRDSDVVVKADGLAAGKGAIVTDSHEQAIEALRSLMVERSLGASGRVVVIEDKLKGREVSAHAFTDGKSVAHMPFSCDHKAIFDGGAGPNTGGMGVYSSPSWLDASTADAIRRDVTEAVVRGLAAEGAPFAGVIFPGLFVTSDGPRVIEFNARFGDPEAEALLPRLQSDLLEIMLACANGTLDAIDVRWQDGASIAVMLASGGYPGTYETGKPISGLEDVDSDVTVFHAGTRIEDRRFVTNGGRVLAVTTTAPTFAE